MITPDPQKDPGYKKSLEYVKQHGDQMKFDTPSQRKDYEALVKANPNNVMGMPAFFPPAKMVCAWSDIREAKECECGGCCIASDRYVCPRCGRDNSNA